jgi:hypothetical protein
VTWQELAPPSIFRLKSENRGLMLSVWWNVLLLVLSVAALPFDHRSILGLSPWIKPIKFEISVIVFLLTIAVLLSAVGRTGKWPRLRAFISWGIAIAMIVENTLIAMQSLRGVRSHMNYATWFDGISFGIMGGFIAFNTVLLALLLGLYCIVRTGLPPALAWGIRLGLLVLLAGSIEGSMIVVHGSHTIGAPDGLAGLPFLNWSMAHGDLRVAHFFALHALQAFTLIGLALSNTRMRAQLQTALVFLAATVYTAMVWLLFEQAMAGKPLLSLIAT